MSSGNVELVRSIFAAWERGDFSSSDWADANIEFASPVGVESVRVAGPRAMAETWRQTMSAFTDVRARAEEYRELDAERVLVLHSFSATGKLSKMSVDERWTRGAMLFRLRHGKVVELVIYVDRERALKELDLGALQEERPQEQAVAVERMRAGIEAFNRGDSEQALAALAPDVEWHFGPWLIDGTVLRSRAEVVSFYSRLRDSAGDWRIEAVEILDLGGGRFLMHQRGRYEGRSTKLAGELDSFQIWELNADGLVARVREYADRDEALRAAGSEQ